MSSALFISHRIEWFGIVSGLSECPRDLQCDEFGLGLGVWDKNLSKIASSSSNSNFTFDLGPNYCNSTKHGSVIQMKAINTMKPPPPMKTCNAW